MPRFATALGALLVAIGAALAQQPSIDPPTTGRPIDFSNIVGKYSLKVTADPTDVRVEGSIVLKILITGEGPAKYEPKRKHLHLFPKSFERDFYVLPLPEEDRIDRDQKNWLFVYRLKPRHDKLDAIDGITLVVYNPDHPGKIKFVSHFADPIDIKVKPKLDKAPDAILDVPLAPESFYSVAETRQILARPATWTLGPWPFAVVVAFPPVMCFAGVVVWRRCFPGEARRMRQFRNAAARRALDALKAGSVCAWEVVCQYLQERLDFTALDPTPAEVAAFLKRRGFAKVLCERSRAFFQDCDAVRFSGSASPQLILEAMCLIEALEAEPCA